MGTYVSPLQSAEVPKDVNKVMARFEVTTACGASAAVSGNGCLVMAHSSFLWLCDGRAVRPAPRGVAGQAAPSRAPRARGGLASPARSGPHVRAHGRTRRHAPAHGRAGPYHVGVESIEESVVSIQ